MEKLDLNISKYSCDELKEIFNIPENIDCDTLPKIIDSYKNNLFLEDNIGLDQKNNITNFLNKVLEKLLSSTGKSSHMNTLISGSPLSHPVIVNPNSLAGQESESIDGRPATFNEYPPGYINPINIKSIRRTLNIDTRFRSMYYSTKSSDFLVTVPDPFKKIVNMRLSSLDLPLTVYTINKSFENYNFVVFSNPGPSYYNIVIPEGNYSSLTPTENVCPYIVTIINQALIDAGSGVTCAIDLATQKFVFSDSTSFTLYFNVKPNPVVGTVSPLEIDDHTPLPLKLGWLLGFRLAEYTSALSGANQLVKSEGICSVIGPRYIYLSVDDFTKAGNNNYEAAFETSTLSPNILARINYQSLVQSKGIFKFGEDDDFSEAFNRSREYFGPVNIQKLHFQFLDEYGRTIDFNNMDWSCALAFDVIYD